MSSIDLWYATRATGLAALVLMSAVVVLGILTAGRAKTSQPGFARLDLHRRLSAMAAVFLAIHVLTSVLDSYVHLNVLSVFVPFAAGYKPGWVAFGAVSVDLFLAVAVTSVLRQRIPAAVWRGVHWLSYLSWPVAVAHSIGIGTDTRLSWVLALVAGCIASVVAATMWRATAMIRRPSVRPPTVFPPRRNLQPSLQRGRPL